MLARIKVRKANYGQRSRPIPIDFCSDRDKGNNQLAIRSRKLVIKSTEISQIANGSAFNDPALHAVCCGMCFVLEFVLRPCFIPFPVIIKVLCFAR